MSKPETVTSDEEARLSMNAIRNLPTDESFAAALAELDEPALYALQHDLEVENIPLQIQERYAPPTPVPTLPGHEAQQPPSRGKVLEGRIAAVRRARAERRKGEK